MSAGTNESDHRVRDVTTAVTMISISSLYENLKLLHQERKVFAMDQTGITLTAPILCPDSTVWFSAYRIGWGYCAFMLSSEVVCEKLGAANVTAKQLVLAFELGKRRLLQAVAQKAHLGTGERIQISAADL